MSDAGSQMLGLVTPDVRTSGKGGGDMVQVFKFLSGSNVQTGDLELKHGLF